MDIAAGLYIYEKVFAPPPARTACAHDEKSNAGYWVMGVFVLLLFLGASLDRWRNSCLRAEELENAKAAARDAEREQYYGSRGLPFVR